MYKWIIPQSVIDDVFGPSPAKWAIVDHTGRVVGVDTSNVCRGVKAALLNMLPDRRYYVIPSVSVR